ncbi:MAG: response regulator [Planctomycetaceae bacterium]|nr:response regulator [Planctomycetaceae bacterium]
MTISEDQVPLTVPKRRPVSLRLMFAAAVGIPVLLLFGFLFISEYYNSRIESAKKMRDTMIREVISRAKMLNHHLTKMTSCPDQIAQSLSIRKPANIGEMLSYQYAMLADNPNIYGNVIAWEPFAFDPKEKYCCPYAWRDMEKDGAVSYKMFNPENNYDYFTGWEWYDEPKKRYNGKPEQTTRPLKLSEQAEKDGKVPRIEPGLWSKPYFDEGGGNVLMCTYSAPFFRDGQFSGVVTCDITTDWMTEFLLQEAFEDGNFVLLGIDGEIISHPKSEYIMKDINSIVRQRKLTDWYVPLRKMEAFAKIFEPERMNSDDLDDSKIYLPALSLEVSALTQNHLCWLEAAQIPETGWLLVYLIPKETVFRVIDARFQSSVFFLTSGLLTICGYLFWHIDRRIIKPLQHLSSATRKISGGDFNYQIAEDKLAGRELLELEENFNTMAVTLRQSIDEAVQNAADKEHAEATSKAKSEILMLAGHELRTPLSGSIGATDLLLQTELSPKQHEYIELQKASNTSLLLLINNILDYSKLDFTAGNVRVYEKDFLLQNTVNAVIETLKLLAESKGLTLRCKWGDGLPRRVRGDESRLRQLLLNLLGNAIKFSKDSGILVNVAAVASDVRLPGKRFIFEVIDHGIGVPPEHQKHLFTQSKIEDISTQYHGGMGLGLTISESIVDALNGTIGHRETPGGGSTFWFSIPLSEAKEEQESKTADDYQMPAPDSAVREKQYRILVAEDNRINRIVIKEILSKAGYESVMAEDGRKAVEIWKNETFDLILMDCQMPDVDGYEATEWIRRIEKEENREHFTPIVALTANAAPLDKEHCLEIGMNAYLNKPIEIPELLKTLRHLMQTNPAA